MRVPSVGLTRDERRIVEEGYRIAEYMLRNYQDPPSLAVTLRRWFASLRASVLARD
ncbi:hypothetical protein JI749_17345 [Devosia oryziradicis]|uniref:Uncharacterized protein n=1 Tax=Devosia oryziradicis TaxID=2801335 RepID=A0ABX7BVU1_9HYPH|nr:hypothetical protein [Devosia oryziradicis]QQR36067.1 hypothetical protein JI749_17345 [Devosia oryziradicis]